MGHLGIPELFVVLVMAVIWVVPIAVTVWALLTLYRLREAQRAVDTKLDTIVRLLQRS